MEWKSQWDLPSEEFKAMFPEEVLEYIRKQTTLKKFGHVPSLVWVLGLTFLKGE